MTKLNTTAPTSTATGNGVGTDDATDRSIAQFYQRADALCRCAVETCRQHERLSRLVRQGAVGIERRAAESLVEVCDEALAEVAGAYEAVASRVCADHDAACWQAANALWMASREYARRHLTSDRAGRHLGDGKHSTDRLAELTVDYDLEASALLALKHATEAYRKLRADTL
jgi:hypothetical protein